VEHVPPPRVGYVWAPGYWRWDHGHHVWVGGRYIHERPGHHWVGHRWVHRGDRWRFEEGHWD
jgi:YXWGXW repeat-containing protein